MRKADVIISGGGLPLGLPGIKAPGDTALVPIVSSARALTLFAKNGKGSATGPMQWCWKDLWREGTSGFKFDELSLESNKLENLFPPVKETAMKYGDFPVIVAGGIYSHGDIVRFLRLGADGVQMGTRFLVTEESSASALYKQAVVDAGREDVIVSQKPGSPCGMPFRVLCSAPMFRTAKNGRRQPHCDKGYLLPKDRQGNSYTCKANSDNGECFCICNGLLSSAGYNPQEEEPLYTVGATGYRVDEVLSVKELMDEPEGDCRRAARGCP